MFLLKIEKLIIFVSIELIELRLASKVFIFHLLDNLLTTTIKILIYLI